MAKVIVFFFGNMSVCVCTDYKGKSYKPKSNCMHVFFFPSHQAGWFPFRPEQQNLGGGERARAPQEEAERHQDIQEMVSWRPTHAASPLRVCARCPQQSRIPAQATPSCPLLSHTVVGAVGQSTPAALRDIA